MSYVGGAVAIRCVMTTLDASSLAGAAPVVLFLNDTYAGSGQHAAGEKLVCAKPLSRAFTDEAYDEATMLLGVVDSSRGLHSSGGSTDVQLVSGLTGKSAAMSVEAVVLRGPVQLSAFSGSESLSLGQRLCIDSAKCKPASAAAVLLEASDKIGANGVHFGIVMNANDAAKTIDVLL